MKKNLMLIVNPVSGKGQAKTALFDILSVFSENEYAVTVFMTEKKGDAEEMAREESEKYDVVVCIGGDGTLSEVMSGLMQAKAPPPLGYIPMGTANDVATTLKLSKNPRAAAQAVVDGKPIPMDVGKLSDKYFSYIAAFGAFTEVSYSTPQETKKVIGHLAYILEGMASLPRITSYHAVVEYDEGTVEGDFVFGGVTNSTSVAGLIKLASDDVALSDGLFEVLLIKNPQKIADMNRIITSILSHNYDPEYVLFLHTKKIKFTFDKSVAWTRDGESGGEYTEVMAENCHCALQVIV